MAAADRPDNSVDPKIKDWATSTQCAAIDAFNQTGSITGAAKKLGVQRSTIRRAIAAAERGAARAGYAPGHFKDGVAPGYAMGKVTVQRGPGGDVERTWERQSPDRFIAEQHLREFVEHLMHDIRGLSPVTPLPEHMSADLLAVYGIGDPHYGMMAWAAESGNTFNLAEAERLTHGAIDRLAQSAPPADTALLINIGDFFHADDGTNRTPQSGNQLDVDGRYGQIMQAGLRSMVHCIRRLKEKHKTVVVWILPGNHDPHSSLAVAMMLDAWFNADPAVVVNLDPGLYKYMRWGKVLLGAHHGHGAKPADLPLLMATDRAQDWGATLFRHIFGGHIHHLVRKEWPGCVWESLRSLAPADAWHAGKGYRAGRDMQLITFHKELGEVERHRCDVGAIERRDGLARRAGRLGLN